MFGFRGWLCFQPVPPVRVNGRVLRTPRALCTLMFMKGAVFTGAIRPLPQFRYTSNFWNNGEQHMPSAFEIYIKKMEEDLRRTGFHRREG